MDRQLLKAWHDGYNLPGAGEVDCPGSVVKSIEKNNFTSYWAAIASFEALADYIFMDFNGLHGMINDLLDGRDIRVVTRTFQNDLGKIKTANDVLVLLVHLGYLAYDFEKQAVRLPNYEIHQHFLDVLTSGPNEDFIKRIRLGEQTLDAAFAMDSDRLSELVTQIHKGRPPVHYNNEEALCHTVLQAFDNSRNLPS